MSTSTIPFSQAMPGQEQSQTGSAANPVLEQLSAGVRAHQDNLAEAGKLLAHTPMYSNSSSAQPALPVPKPAILGNASASNVQRPVTTPAGARSRGIGALAGLAGGIIGSYMKKKEAEKTQQLSLDLNRSLELTKGIEEAKAALAQDPNNKEAQMTLQKNQAQMGALMSDPKRAKAIAKAYDVTFGEEAKDKVNTPEARAMQGAMRAHQMEEQLPSRIQTNPAYIQAQASYKQAAAEAQKATETYTKMAQTVTQQEGATERNTQSNQTKLQMNENTLRMRGAITDANNKTRFDIERNRAVTDIQKAKIQGQYKIAAVREAAKNNDQLKARKMAEDGWKATGVQIGKVNDQIDKMKQQLALTRDKALEPDQKVMIQGRITDLEEYKRTLSETQSQLDMEMHGDPDAAAVYNLMHSDDM